MPAPKKYPDELRERAVRLVLESGRPIAHIAKDLGIHREALRQWVRQAEGDHGSPRDRLTSDERERLKALERENRELRKANEILKAASVFFAKELDLTRPKCEPLHRRGMAALRGRVHLPVFERVGARGLPARDGRVLGTHGRARPAAETPPRRPR